MSRINLKIERLVLRGFDTADGRAVAEGIKQELSRIFSDPSRIPTRFRSQRTPVLQLGVMALETGIPGRRKFGAGMARAIGRALK